MAADKIRVIHYGLGPIGIETARAVLMKPRMKIVGAVDIAKSMVGKDLGEVLGIGQKLGISITDQTRGLLARSKADVVIHTAGSRIRNIYKQFEEILKTGTNIISSSEELLFPALENPELAEKIHKLALKHNATVLGTGVNPGFVMDALPLFLTGVCQEVQEVHVERIVDAGTRRYPLQKKIGAGMTPEAFRKAVEKKELGHVGLMESLHLIADKLSLSFDKVRERIDPVVARKPMKTAYFALKPGDVAGIKHIAEGIKGGKKIITLDLRMFIGAKDPHDAIHIAGIPDIHLRIEGGVAGDQATAAILVNSIPAVVDAKPGLMTVKDLPAPYCHA